MEIKLEKERKIGGKNIGIGENTQRGEFAVGILRDKLGRVVVKIEKGEPNS